jgi:metallo-beta-lactamase class B
MRSATTSAILTSILALTAPSLQQKVTPTTNFTAWDPPTVYPAEQSANVSRYLEEAFELSSPNFRHIFQTRCITKQVYEFLSSGASEPGWVEPYPAFDGVYFVGTTWVSAWAMNTGDGLVLIDALDNADEAREILIAGIQKFGFEGTDIKAVLVTHEHADHYGGALWLQETFDVPVYMSEIAWDGLATNPGIIEPPTRNLTFEDGVGVTVGNVTFTPIATPGHTAGTVSLFFPVYDKGVKHGECPFSSLIQASALADMQPHSGGALRRPRNSRQGRRQGDASTIV